MLLHDWISIEPEISTGILTIKDDEVRVGIVKDFGVGYIADNGTFVKNIELTIGNKIIFTQHLTFDVDGVKIYRVRGRDVIEVFNAKV